MSKVAQDYVLSLDSKRVNRHQHHLLLILAWYHQSARETFWPSHKTLAQRLHINEGEGNESDQRQVRRLVQECVALGILDFESGVGRGNRGSYVFLELGNRTAEAENRTPQSAFDDLNPDRKPDNTQPVRSIEVNLTNTKSKSTHPNPPFQGENCVQKALTVRQVRHLNLEIYESMRDPQIDLKTAVETACARLLIPLDQAWATVKAAGIGEIKKEPQSEIA